MRMKIAIGYMYYRLLNKICVIPNVRTVSDDENENSNRIHVLQVIKQNFSNSKWIIKAIGYIYYRLFNKICPIPNVCTVSDHENENNNRKHVLQVIKNKDVWFQMNALCRTMRIIINTGSLHTTSESWEHFTLSLPIFAKSVLSASHLFELFKVFLI